MPPAGSSTRLSLAGLALDAPGGASRRDGAPAPPSAPPGLQAPAGARGGVPGPPPHQIGGQRDDVGNPNCGMCRLHNSHQRLFQSNRQLVADMLQLRYDMRKLEEEQRNTNAQVIELKQKLAQQDLFAQQALRQVDALTKQLGEQEESGKRTLAELWTVRTSWVMALEDMWKEKRALELEKQALEQQVLSMRRSEAEHEAIRT